MQKKKQGISLIVLVITIIVMIILATTVIMSLNNSKIIDNANEAAKLTQINQEKEMIMVAVIMAQKDNATKRTMTVQNLNNTFGNNEVEVGFIGEDVNIYIKKTQNCYRVKNGSSIEYIGQNMYIEDDTPGTLASETRKNAQNEDITVYKIESVEDLVEWAANTTYNNKNIVLEKDLNLSLMFSYADYTTETYGDINNNGVVEELAIELTTGEGFSPKAGFSGTFDGQGHIIDGLYINKEEKASLILEASGSTIKNLTVGGEIISSYEAAGIVNLMQSTTMENCINKCDVTVKGITKAYPRAAGIGTIGAWDEKTTITNCKNYGTIKMGSVSEAGGHGCVGGIVSAGGTDVEIINCENYGNIIANAAGYHSGVAGIYGASGGKIKILNCYNIGNITQLNLAINSDNTCAGIVGKLSAPSGAQIYNSYNVGDVTGAVYTGGIVANILLGDNNGAYEVYIENVYNLGNIDKGDNTSLMIAEIVGRAAMKKEDTIYSLKKAYYVEGKNAYFNDYGLTEIDTIAFNKTTGLNTLLTSLNNNRTGHDDWKEWKMGDKGYPVFK